MERGPESRMVLFSFPLPRTCFSRCWTLDAQCYNPFGFTQATARAAPIVPRLCSSFNWYAPGASLAPWGDMATLPASSPDVTVIVVTWNSAAYLPLCLQALTAQSYRDFEVVIADNASSDGSVDGLAASYPGLQLRVERLDSNRGFAAANNVAAAIARGRWLALLNPDAYPDSDWLEQLVKAANSTPKSFFACRQIQVGRPRLLDGEGDLYHISGLALRRNFNFPVFGGAQPREVFSACAAAALYPRQQFLDAGGFDEDYFAYHEDVDLGFRLRLRGLKCIYIPAAVVHHVGTASTGAKGYISTYYGHRNLVWTYVKDMPKPWFWIYLPLHLAVDLLTIPYFMLSGRGRAIWRAKIDALRGLPAALKKRAAIQAQRSVPPAEVLGVMSRNPFAPLSGWVARHYPPLD